MLLKTLQLILGKTQIFWLQEIKGQWQIFQEKEERRICVAHSEKGLQVPIASQ